MEKKNYEFKAFTSKGKEIKFQWCNVFYDITEEMAQGIKMGMMMGLYEKYKDPQVRLREI